MGLKASYKRRQRRKGKMKVKPRHKLVGGRTGSKRFKQRAGALHQMRKEKL